VLCAFWRSPEALCCWFATSLLEIVPFCLLLLRALPPARGLIAKLRRMQFGRSSEKLDRQIEQLELRLEALQQNDAEMVAAMPGKIASVEPVARSSRRPLPAHLPREVRTHLPKQQACPDCGGELRKLGEDVSEVLELHYGIRRDGTRELLAFTWAKSESQAGWEGLLNDLCRRRLFGASL
jgi:hypothetical protein